MAEEETVVAKTAAAPSPGGQFSLRTLLLLPVMAGALLSWVYASPSPIIGFGAFTIVVLSPALLTTVAIYGKGYARVFAIGALFPLAAVFYLLCAQPIVLGTQTMTVLWYGAEYLRWSAIAGWIAAGTTGGLCVCVRWALVSPQGWRQLLVLTILLMLVLAGPIIDQIGQMRGWWGWTGTNANAPMTYSPPSY